MREASQIAAEFDASVNKLPDPKTSSVRKLRRQLSADLSQKEPDLVFQVASKLIDDFGQPWVAYELIANHKRAYNQVEPNRLETLGRGIDSWHTVDAFARILSGPAWRDDLITDDTIHRWARSSDRWWRRSALVSTVALNVRTHGGKGDVNKTLSVCRMLAPDHDDMVVRALSWALRELVVHDPANVARFLDNHENQLAARVKREVRNKLATGLKSGSRS